MPCLASDIMEKAGILLSDEENVRWPLPERCKWLNEGVAAILLAKPSAHSITTPISLVEGTLQEIPDTCSSLLQLVRNLKSTTPLMGGRMISPTTREILDANDPYWHDTDHSPLKAEVRNFVYSTDDPRHFYVYPGNDGTGIVEAVLATMPDPVVATGNPDLLASYEVEVGLHPTYAMPLTDFVCFRAQSKDDDGSVTGRAMAHYSAFANAIGLKIQNARSYSPSDQSVRT